MPNPAHRIGPIAFKQMKSNSLRRLLSDAGHAPKTINQANEKR
jgi:hypothetical protein